MLADKTLTGRFQRFDRLCRHAAGSRVDAKDIHQVVHDVQGYGRHVRERVSAHLDGKPMPAGPPGVINPDD